MKKLLFIVIGIAVLLVFYFGMDFMVKKSESLFSGETHFKKIERLFSKAEMFDKMGQYDDAIVCMDSVLMIEERNFMAVNAKGWLYFSKGDSAKAIETFQSILDVDGTCAQAYFSIGELYARKKNLPKALKYLHKADSINNEYLIYPMPSNHPEVSTDELNYWYGSVCYELEDYTQAFRRLTLAKMMDGAYQSDVLFLRGELMLRGDMKDSACIDLKKSAELGNEKAAQYAEKYCK